VANENRIVIIHDDICNFYGVGTQIVLPATVVVYFVSVRLSILLITGLPNGPVLFCSLVSVIVCRRL